MINKGVRKFVEIGPGKVLSGLVKRIDKSVTIVSINELDDLQVKFDYVDKCMKNILERQWHIKNVIEWRKFTNGAT